MLCRPNLVTQAVHAISKLGGVKFPQALRATCVFVGIDANFQVYEQACMGVAGMGFRRGPQPANHGHFRINTMLDLCIASYVGDCSTFSGTSPVRIDYMWFSPGVIVKPFACGEAFKDHIPSASVLSFASCTKTTTCKMRVLGCDGNQLPDLACRDLFLQYLGAMPCILMHVDKISHCHILNSNV